MQEVSCTRPLLRLTICGLSSLFAHILLLVFCCKQAARSRGRNNKQQASASSRHVEVNIEQQGVGWGVNTYSGPLRTTGHNCSLY